MHDSVLFKKNFWLGLSRILPRCTLDVRTRALAEMFDIMKVFGHHFESLWWKDLFQVVFRVFDDKKMQVCIRLWFVSPLVTFFMFCRLCKVNRIKTTGSTSHAAVCCGK